MSSGPNRKVAELREIADEELISKLSEAKEELFNLRFQTVTGQLENNRRLQTVRREIARIYTVLRERELGMVPAPVPAADSADKTKESKDDKQAAEQKEEVAA